MRIVSLSSHSEDVGSLDHASLCEPDFGSVATAVITQDTSGTGRILRSTPPKRSKKKTMTVTHRTAGSTPHVLKAGQATLAVYAPFGTDPVLSGYPEGTTKTLAQHPLMRHLASIARSGTPVVAIIDRLGDDTRLVTFNAGDAEPTVASRGKLDMQDPQSLATLLREAHGFAPGNDCILTIEGHGAGYLPDLDLKALALATGGTDAALAQAADGNPVLPGGSPTSKTSDPVLPGGSPTSFGSNPVLPGGSPTSRAAALGNPVLPGGSPTSRTGGDPVLPGGSPTSLTGDPVLPGGSPTSLTGDPVLPGGSPTSRDGDPTLPGGSVVLPGGSPTSPSVHAAMATAAIGEALRLALEAGVPRIAVIHFNNCFNMSVEVLHTVAPYAEYATGYCNYNFFTAAQSYPAVFARLAASVSATSEQVAKWFAAENHDVLAAAGHEPTVAGTVELARMHHIAEKVDDLADELLAALRDATPAARPGVVAQIRQAIVAAQKYDTSGDFVLGAPDELTDLDSLAHELMQLRFEHAEVHAAADALRNALAGIKQYGDYGAAWMAPGDLWNFSSKYLAMNIFLPDPLREGLWDWRSKFYLDVNPDPNKPQLQRRIIDFVKVTDWVDFLREYHRDTAYVGVMEARLPDTPVLHSTFDPRHPAHPVDARRPLAHARAAASRATLK